jgi:hypothetical protein
MLLLLRIIFHLEPEVSVFNNVVGCYAMSVAQQLASFQRRNIVQTVQEVQQELVVDVMAIVNSVYMMCKGCS